MTFYGACVCVCPRHDVRATRKQNYSPNCRDDSTDKKHAHDCHMFSLWAGRHACGPCGRGMRSMWAGHICNESEHGSKIEPPQSFRHGLDTRTTVGDVGVDDK